MHCHVNFSLFVCLILLWIAVPTHAATTTCSYNFSTGIGNTYLSYCVTVNGNILGIQTPFGQTMLGPNGEGYGVCNESPAQNYTDYAVSDTGNWKNAVVLSHSSTSVKIARTTADGNWTLTQNITVTHSPSITVVMGLKNNQSVQKVAYLVRFADAALSGGANYDTYMSGVDSALAFFAIAPGKDYGLFLQNVGRPPFGFWQGYAQDVPTGPNACAFAFNSAEYIVDGIGSASIEVAYVGPVPAGGTKTVTLTYRGL